MQTRSAVITEVDANYQQGRERKVWMQLNCGEAFPIHHVFSVDYLADATRIIEIMKFAKVKEMEDLVGKKVRVVVEQDGVYTRPIAIGSERKNRFIDLSGGEFPVSERRVFIRHKLAKKLRMFINNLKIKIQKRVS